MAPSIGTYKRDGRSLSVRIPKQITEQLPWRPGDSIAVRTAGEKLVLERIPLEQLAILRTGEPTR